MLLEGLHIPVTTPFYPDGRLNLPKLAANVVRYSKSPAAGLLVLGPSGEPDLLSDDESREVLRTVAESATPEMVLLAAIFRDGLRSTLTLAEFAAEMQYDAVLAAVPSFLAHQSSPSGEDAAPRSELLLYFQALADHSPIPLVLFSDRARPIPLDAAVQLAANPHILGLLDAAAEPGEIETLLRRTAAIHREVAVTPVFSAVTARMRSRAASIASHAPAASTHANPPSEKPTAEQTTSAAATAVESPEPSPAPASTSLRERTKSVAFQILIGNTQAIYAGLRAGAVGAAPPFAACAPQACYEIYAGWKDNDSALAEEKQERLRQAASLVESGSKGVIEVGSKASLQAANIDPGSLKFACEINGYFGGRPRLPRLPLTGNQRAAIENIMRPLHN